MGSVTKLRSHSHADQKNDDDDDMFATSETMDATARGRLKSFVERYENVQREIDELKEGQKEIKAELKGEGFDVKIFARVIALRKIDPAKRAEAEAILDLYLAAIGEV